MDADDEYEVLTIELSLNVGGLRFPFEITIKRDSLDDVVGAMAEQAASSIGVVDMVRGK